MNKKNKKGNGIVIGKILRTDTMEFVVFIDESKAGPVLRMGLQFINRDTGESKRGYTVKLFKGELKQVRGFFRDAAKYFKRYEALKASTMKNTKKGKRS